MYGTWKRLKAVAVARNATNTQMPDAPGARPAGTANVSTNPTGRAIAPTSIHVRRVPVRARARSLRAPIHGSITTSHTLAAVTTRPAIERGHPEGVGEVVHEHEAGQGREAAGADRTDRVAGDDPARERSLRCGHGGSVLTRRRSGSIDLDCADARRDRLPRPVRAPHRRRRRVGCRSRPRAHAVDRRGAARAAPFERRRRARRGRPGAARAAGVGARGVRRAPSRAARRARPLLERRDLLLDLVQLESGKTRGQAFEEVYQAAGVTRYNALAARRVLGGRRARSGMPTVTTTRVRYRPKGVVGVITPWNYALSLAAMDVDPRPRRRLRRRAEGRRPGRADDPRAAPRVHRRRSARGAVGGRRRPGRRGRRGADRRRRLRLLHRVDRDRPQDRREGRAAPASGHPSNSAARTPCIVLDDVDPEQAAANAAYAVLLGDGAAVRLDRAHLRAPRASPTPFTARPRRARFARRARARRSTTTTDFGSLASAAQLERVEAHLDDARREGRDRARRRPGTARSRPVVLRADRAHRRHARHDACYAEETFGAIASPLPRRQRRGGRARRERERVRAERVGASRVRRAVRRRVADALEAGSVNINEGYRGSFSSVDAPMGGVKQSGLGRRNGAGGPAALRRPRHDLVDDRAHAAAAHRAEDSTRSSRWCCSRVRSRLRRRR